MEIIKKLFAGYGGLLKYPFSRDSKSLIGFRAGLPFMLIVLGSVGVLRNFLEVLIGGTWANAWFALRVDVFFTMVFYPIFLCFFGTTILYFFSRLFKLALKLEDLLSLFFLLQVTHLIIPFLDGIAHVLHLPHGYLITTSTYIKLIFSPLAWTPLIMFFTRPTSFGIDVVWLFVTFVLLKLYLKQYRFPLLRALAALGITFYITYLTIYPVYSFFLNERVMGSNFMFGLFFLFLSIPSVIFVIMMKPGKQGSDNI